MIVTANALRLAEGSRNERTHPAPRFRQPRVDSAPLRERLNCTPATHYRIAQLASVSPRFVKDVAVGRTKTLSRPYCDALMTAVAQAERELANRVVTVGVPP